MQFYSINNSDDEQLKANDMAVAQEYSSTIDNDQKITSNSV